MRLPRMHFVWRKGSLVWMVRQEAQCQERVRVLRVACVGLFQEHMGCICVFCGSCVDCELDSSLAENTDGCCRERVLLRVVLVGLTQENVGCVCVFGGC